jgi:hypothetical protein
MQVNLFILLSQFQRKDVFGTSINGSRAKYSDSRMEQNGRPSKSAGVLSWNGAFSI